MKKLILGFSALMCAYSSFSQVVVSGVSPVAVVGNYEFTWADPGGNDWGTPDLSVPNTYVQDTLIVVNDGTVGNNATYGTPLAIESCNPSPANAYAGKIAVLRRNTCEFGVKAKNAEVAGAVAVIIINRDNEVISMGGGAEGINVTIPVVMLTRSAGDALLAEMQNGPVVMFIGNKMLKNADDVGTSKSLIMIAPQASTPSALAQNGTDFKFTPGLSLTNFGTNDQTGMSVNCKIDAPGQPAAYNQTLTFDMLSEDTIDIFEGNPTTFPQFALASYPVGKYTITYTLSLASATDQDTSDNKFSSEFYITDNIFSYARAVSSDSLVVNSFPKNYDDKYKTCIHFKNPNASRLGVQGMFMALEVPTTADVTAQEIPFYAYEWNDAKQTYDSATFTSLVDKASGIFQTDGLYNNGDVRFTSFSTPFILIDNKSYLFCATTINAEPAIGYDNEMNYNANMVISGQAYNPIYIDMITETDSRWFSAGWSGQAGPSIGLKMFPAAELGIKELNTMNGSAYPNPASNNVSIVIEDSGKGKIVVTDLTGKTVIATENNFVQGKTNVDMSSLQSGMYIFNVTLENGKVAQFNVVKQ